MKSDKFQPSDRVQLVEDRKAFESGASPHKPNVGVVQGYARGTIRKPAQPTVVVRWHKGFANGYLEETLEPAPQ